MATSMDAVSYHQYKPRLREQILAVYQSLARKSTRRWCWKAPAVRLGEINLRDRDIAGIWAWPRWRNAR
ncbi:hypothetical protein ACLFLT_20225 [Klebsiella pneumoniae]